MDMIYCEQPVFVLFPVLLTVFQIVLVWLDRKKRVSSTVHAVLTGICLVGHAAAIAVILLYGGTLSDVLLLVLLSGTVALCLSPTPNKTADTTEEETP